jgi:hypothetical protein
MSGVCTVIVPCGIGATAVTTGFPLHPPLLLPPLLLLLPLLLPLLLLPLPLLLALLPPAPLLLPLLLLVAPELPPSMSNTAVASLGVEPSTLPPEPLAVPELPFDPPELPDEEAWPELAASPPSSGIVSGFDPLPPHAISAPAPASAGIKNATWALCDQRPPTAFLSMNMSSETSFFVCGRRCGVVADAPSAAVCQRGCLLLCCVRNLPAP